MTEHRRARLIAMGILAVIVLVLGTAFVLGGQSTTTDESAGSASSSSGSTVARLAPAVPPQVSHGSRHQAENAPAMAVPSPAPTAATGAAAGVAASGATAMGQVESAVDSVTATRVVKTGSLSLQVPRGQVQSTIAKLVKTTGNLNGYVEQSRTDNVDGSPQGEVVLRVPVANFEAAVTAAQQLGHVVSLTTSAQDVTGKVVDLGARLTALRHTRATYLTILGHARTIGATLEVQQRVDDVQQRIEELQGQLKVLRNQSSDSTLTVDVAQIGSLVPVVHHEHTGIGAAWHTSINRFSRGFDSIVSDLGPLLLAVLILAVLYGIARLGYRGVRRATS